jgi:hypothetical protein
MNKLTKTLKELIPIFIIIFFLFFFRTEIVITILAILGITLTFIIRYHKKEYLVLIFGITIGLIFEFIGNFWLGQNWPEASFFTIPIWLPLTWGYGFVIIRRIGNILAEK